MLYIRKWQLYGAWKPLVHNIRCSQSLSYISLSWKGRRDSNLNFVVMWKLIIWQKIGSKLSTIQWKFDSWFNFDNFSSIICVWMITYIFHDRVHIIIQGFYFTRHYWHYFLFAIKTKVVNILSHHCKFYIRT